jgi:hypothetical protein
MKKSWLVLVLVLFSFSFVNAADDCTIQSSCSAGKYEVTGLGFYSNSNTHVGFGVDDYVLCCDYDGLSFVEVVITSPNYNFLMFNNLNSHITFEANQYWYDGGYNTKVDVDGVICSSISSGSCPSGVNDFCLFSASAGGNAHVSSCSDSNYGWKMCCEHSPSFTECVVNNDCDDSNVCTEDVCNGGICENSYNTNSCNDGDSCTVSDICSSGSCSGTEITSCDDGDGCCPHGCVYDDDSDCSSSAPVVGPDEYIVYTSCEEDGDGNQYGVSNWTLYAGNGSQLNSSSALCILYSSEVPFSGIIGILLFFVLIFGFYLKESYLNSNHINKKRGEKICK